MPDKKTPSRLINEKSPYLLEHAHNPVDWYPWGQEAFAKAKEEDKPVFFPVRFLPAIEVMSATANKIKVGGCSVESKTGCMGRNAV